MGRWKSPAGGGKCGLPHLVAKLLGESVTGRNIIGKMCKIKWVGWWHIGFGGAGLLFGLFGELFFGLFQDYFSDFFGLCVTTFIYGGIEND